MIDVGSILRGCAGTFDCTLPTRPTPAFVEVAPGTAIPSSVQGFFLLYQPSGGGTSMPFVVPPKVAPYATRHWLIRNSSLPLLGQGSVDADNVQGTVWPSPKGWAQPRRIARVPRSLVILGYATVAGFADFITAMDTAVQPLSALGVDVCLSTNQPRFSSALGVESVAYHPTLSDAASGSYYSQVGVVTPTLATDMEGGDVMYAAVGIYSSGFQTEEQPVSIGGGFAAWGLGASNTEAGYLVVMGSSASPPNFADPSALLATEPDPLNPGFDFYYTGLTTVAAAEAAMLLAVADRCRKFQFDVYGNVDNPTLDGITLLTPIEAGDLLRNGVPGNGYTWSFSNVTALANQIVANALDFFS